MYQIKREGWLKTLFRQQRLCSNMTINGEKERTLKEAVVIPSRLLLRHSSWETEGNYKISHDSWSSDKIRNQVTPSPTERTLLRRPARCEEGSIWWLSRGSPGGSCLPSQTQALAFDSSCCKEITPYCTFWFSDIKFIGIVLCQLMKLLKLYYVSSLSLRFITCTLLQV